MKTTEQLSVLTSVELEFNKVTDEDIDILQEYFSTYPSRSCDFSIGGVLIWNNFYDYYYAIANDSLILMGTWPGSDLKIFYEPRGPISTENYNRIVSNYCRENNLKGIILFPEEYAPVPEGDGRPVEQTLMPDWMEYVYDIDKFINFPGKKMSKKRNHLNFFNNHYTDVAVEEISEDSADELIAFTKKFSQSHSGDEVANYESHEVEDALRSYNKYPYYGIIIRVNGEIAAYTFGEAIGDTMIIHAEKADIAYGGIYQAIASYFAEAVSKKYPEVRYLNREDDMGSEDLRKSKLSYHPSMFIGKRVIAI